MEPLKYTIAFRYDNAEDNALLARIRQLPRHVYQSFYIYKSPGSPDSMPVFTEHATGTVTKGVLAEEAIAILLDPSAAPVIRARRLAQQTREMQTFCDMLAERPLDAPPFYAVRLKPTYDTDLDELIQQLPTHLKRHVHVEYIHPLARFRTPDVKIADASMEPRQLTFQEILKLLISMGEL